MFDKRALAIAYYSAMGRYWFNKFITMSSNEPENLFGVRQAEINTIINLEKLVEAINS